MDGHTSIFGPKPPPSDDQLRQMCAWKRPRIWGATPVSTILAPMMARMKKAARKYGKLQEVWEACLEGDANADLRAHCEVTGYANGVVTVTMDSAPHRFTLNLMLEGELLPKLRAAFKAGAIQKIRLIQGVLERNKPQPPPSSQEREAEETRRILDEVFTPDEQYLRPALY